MKVKQNTSGQRAPSRARRMIQVNTCSPSPPEIFADLLLDSRPLITFYVVVES